MHLDQFSSLQMAQTERYQKEVVGESAFNTCDAYALAAAIDDDLVTESEEVKIPPLPSLLTS